MDELEKNIELLAWLREHDGPEMWWHRIPHLISSCVMRLVLDNAEAIKVGLRVMAQSGDTCFGLCCARHSQWRAWDETQLTHNSASALDALRALDYAPESEG